MCVIYLQTALFFHDVKIRFVMVLYSLLDSSCVLPILYRIKFKYTTVSIFEAIIKTLLLATAINLGDIKPSHLISPKQIKDVDFARIK